MTAPSRHVHLDTSFLIRALVPSSPQDRRLRAWLREGRPLAMSAVAWAEFRCGPATPEHLQLAARVVGEILPFTSDEAELAAALFNASGRKRGSLLDCMIAATARGHRAVVATENREDFERLGVEVT